MKLKLPRPPYKKWRNAVPRIPDLLYTLDANEDDAHQAYLNNGFK